MDVVIIVILVLALIVFIGGVYLNRANRND